jgi:putative hemolysin
MDYHLLLIILTLLLIAFFSAAEGAILSVPMVTAKQMATMKSRRAKNLLYLKEHLSETIITILICNTLANILSAVLTTTFTIEVFGDTSLGIATGILTFVTLTFAEIIPKTFASKNMKKTALFVSPIILIIYRILTPIVWFFELISKAVNKIGKKGEKEAPLVTEKEIKYLVNIGESEGEINEHEKKIIHNVFKFNDTTVKEVMTPREKVFAIEWDTKIKEALPLAAEQGYSRFVVYDQNIDNMKGVVIVQDMMDAMLRDETDKTLRSIVVSAVFFTPNQKIDYAMRMLQLKHTHMAIVIDSRRKFKGIITMEDLLEELVGEIFDESDRIEHLLKKIDKKEWLVNTRADLRTVNKEIGLHLPITDQFKSLDAFLKEKMPEIKRGSEFYFEKDNATFTVRKAFEGTAQQVIIKKKKRK